MGREQARIDGQEKVTGRAKYTGDIKLHGMLYAKFLFSRYPHAKILAVHTEKARSLPGVRGVITAQDVPGSNYWDGFRIFADDKVRYVGDAVAAVAADTLELAEEAIKLIEVEYEVLPAVFSIEDALAKDAPVIHDHAPDNIIPHSYYSVRKGDGEYPLAGCDLVLEREYRTSFVEHAYIEPEACVVDPGQSDMLVIYASAQNPYCPREVVARALKLPYTKVKVIQTNLGGTFGGKQEGVCLMCARVALLAKKTGKPVKAVYTREESIKASAKRHPFILKYKVGATKEGKIVGLEATLIDEGGGNNNQAQYQNWRGSVHAAGPYEIPHVKVDVYGVYTNNIYGGAMRGFTSPKIIYAHEHLMDELAEKLGMDPVELRLKNILKPGSVTATGQKLIHQSVVLEEVIQLAVEKSGYLEKRKRPRSGGDKKYGIGLACAFRGCGFGAEAYDGTSSKVSIQEDGSIFVYSGLVENGQGLKTVHSQIVAEALGVNFDRIHYLCCDTSEMPHSGLTVASRGTFSGGQSMLAAAQKVKKTMLKIAADMLHCSAEDLTIEKEKIFIRHKPEKFVSYLDVVGQCPWGGGGFLTEMGWNKPSIMPDWDRYTGQGDAFPTYVYNCVIAEVVVDGKTGKVDVQKVLSVHDVGRAINPGLAKGQIYGGIAMGTGFAIMEKVETQEGYVKSDNFDRYLIPTSLDMPEVEAVLFESCDENGPYHAKSLGEPATETVGAAIANAIANAVGERVFQLPAQLEDVFALKSGEEGDENA